MISCSLLTHPSVNGTLRAAHSDAASFVCSGACGMLEAIDHIGFAVRDIDESIAFYSAMFGVTDWERIAMPARFMDVAAARVGGVLLELIAPTSEAASFAKHLRERGPGMHHIAYRVKDIAGALAQLKACGAQLIDETPHVGLHNNLVAFVHPKSMQGVLVELVQHQGKG
jgi:methylmalonyl-CoA/ethylmalonyl-CoA epimerase